MSYTPQEVHMGIIDTLAIALVAVGLLALAGVINGQRQRHVVRRTVRIDDERYPRQQHRQD